ncbi:MAG TPA: hypothetical protein DDX92_06300 [Flavobacteriales bacterium]|jgi:hypothetical protein|nr:hypothetical protein [Flavobacteriales bacterium]
MSVVKFIPNPLIYNLSVIFIGGALLYFNILPNVLVMFLTLLLTFMFSLLAYIYLGYTFSLFVKENFFSYYENHKSLNKFNEEVTFIKPSVYLDSNFTEKLDAMRYKCLFKYYYSFLFIFITLMLNIALWVLL